MDDYTGIDAQHDKEFHNEEMVMSDIVESVEFESTPVDMTFNSYCDKAQLYNTIKDCFRDTRMNYFALGLCGESGEIAEKVKRVIRGDYKYNSFEDLRKNLIKELGDVLWYVAMFADLLGSSLKEVAEENIKKLEDRKLRNIINGEGDDR